MGDLVDDRELFTINTYLADKECTIKLIRWLLKSIFLWPRLSKISNIDRILSKFAIFTCFSALLITIVSIALVLFVEERGNIDMMMTHIGPFVCFVMGVMKYICLLLHVDDIRICVDSIELDWNIIKSNEDHEVMLRDAKIGRLMATLMTAFLHGGVQFYGISRCFIKNVVEVDNVNVSVRELPYPFYHKILDVRFSPAYEVVLLMHIISSFLLAGIFCTSCGLMAIFVMHACGQLKILTMWLSDIAPDNGFVNVNAVQQKLGFIVEHHLRVINFMSHIEEVIYMICLVELIGGSLTLCVVGYCSIMAWNEDNKERIPMYCVVALSFTLNIFIICYIAEILSDQNKRVGMATYMTKWYHLPPKTALSLLLINLRSNVNISLTAGKMIELSLYTFGNVLKAAMTYLNMLRQVIA